jgi:putative glutamine amidotransferase
MKAPYDQVQHKVDLPEDGLLQQLLQRDKLGVNSYHHQGIKDLGAGLEVIAISTDGLIESISLPGAKFVLGVQWHPEFFNAATVENQALMAAFLTACK